MYRDNIVSYYKTKFAIICVEHLVKVLVFVFSGRFCEKRLDILLSVRYKEKER